MGASEEEAEELAASKDMKGDKNLINDIPNGYVDPAAKEIVDQVLKAKSVFDIFDHKKTPNPTAHDNNSVKVNFFKKLEIVMENLKWGRKRADLKYKGAEEAYDCLIKAEALLSQSTGWQVAATDKPYAGGRTACDFVVSDDAAKMVSKFSDKSDQEQAKKAAKSILESKTFLGLFGCTDVETTHDLEAKSAKRRCMPLYQQKMKGLSDALKISNFYSSDLATNLSEAKSCLDHAFKNYLENEAGWIFAYNQGDHIMRQKPFATACDFVKAEPKTAGFEEILDSVGKSQLDALKNKINARLANGKAENQALDEIKADAAQYEGIKTAEAKAESLARKGILRRKIEDAVGLFGIPAEA